MKIRNLCILILIALMITSCAQAKVVEPSKPLLKETNETTTKTPEALTFEIKESEYTLQLKEAKPEEIGGSLISATLLSNAENPKALYEESDVVAIVTVTSIDEIVTYVENLEMFVFPGTYGTVGIVEVISGNLNPGDIVPFIRSGGIVPFEQYKESLYDRRRNDLDKALEEGLKPPKFVKQYLNEDIDIELGKTYLAYLVKRTDPRDESRVMYGIIGFMGGLREAKLDPNSKSNTQVFNNFTQEWENLNSIIPVE